MTSCAIAAGQRVVLAVVANSSCGSGRSHLEMRCEAVKCLDDFCLEIYKKRVGCGWYGVCYLVFTTYMCYVLISVEYG